MTISEFYRRFPDEQSCRDHLKRSREKSGVYCKKCACTKHYWLKAKEQWQCKTCSFRTTLRSGTLFESSKLPIKKWYEALYLVCNTKKGISACELQRQLGLKRNEPAWYMLHKIRKTMARINEHEQLCGDMVLDDVFFTTIDKKSALPPKRRHRHSTGNRKQKALIMAESSFPFRKNNIDKFGKLRILAVKNVYEETVWGIEDQHLPRVTRLKTDVYRSHKILDPHKHEPNVIKYSSSHIIPPWIHTAISNIKRLFNGIYHHMSDKFAQLYFDEFVFKFNYRHRNDKWNKVLNYSLKRNW